ncbi:MAG: TIM barrel protein [Planctomycetales bacterium]|nr:TIM barrel protein [Planctomycetales bacterium]
MSQNRRSWLSAAAGVAALGSALSPKSIAQDGDQEKAQPSAEFKGRIRQSVMGWCFNPMSAADLARMGKKHGLVAIEGINSSHYPDVKALGLEISLVGSHGFAKGPIDTNNQDEVEATLRNSIDIAVEFGCPNVITFTGMRVPGMVDATAKRNCLDGWKRVIAYAEEKNITLCLEHLNSRDDSHPMKGHPGYFGDNVDLCIELIKQMDSPNFRLLFDIYHVQVMHGDVIRRIRELHPWIAHYHTAGNPGRCEIDENQEINYPPIMRAILETGYAGYVAQEFIPTWDDHEKSLAHAIQVCDV